MRERETKETPARGGGRGNIPPEVDEWLLNRSDAFRRGTQRKGMPTTYGAGKERVKVPPPPREGG